MYSKKSVKHLNFRLTQSTLKVSVPSDIDEQVLVDGIYAKIPWAIRSYHALMIENRTMIRFGVRDWMWQIG